MQSLKSSDFTSPWTFAKTTTPIEISRLCPTPPPPHRRLIFNRSIIVMPHTSRRKIYIWKPKPSTSQTVLLLLHTTKSQLSCRFKFLWRQWYVVVNSRNYIPYTIYFIIDTVQDFLIKLGIKSRLHLWEISIFSLNNVIVRPTKIKSRDDKNWVHF